MIQSLNLGDNENKLLLGLVEKARKAAARRRNRAASSRKGSRQDSIPNTTSTYWRSTSFQCETIDRCTTTRVPFSVKQQVSMY